MTKERKKLYQETDSLRRILMEALKGQRFRLDCGHHITFGHHLGNDLTIHNGRRLRIICSQCGY